jgi:hypothetical protein
LDLYSHTESTYDWEIEQWSVPINGVVSKVTKIGSQLVSVGGGVRYWADSADSGPEGLGFRLSPPLAAAVPEMNNLTSGE